MQYNYLDFFFFFKESCGCQSHAVSFSLLLGTRQYLCQIPTMLPPLNLLHLVWPDMPSFYFSLSLFFSLSLPLPSVSFLSLTHTYTYICSLFSLSVGFSISVCFCLSSLYLSLSSHLRNAICPTIPVYHTCQVKQQHNNSTT